MSNVVNFEERMTKAATGMLHPRVLPHSRGGRTSGDVAEKIKFAVPFATPAEALEKAVDDYRATMLDLAHRRQEFEMQMMLEANTAQIKLEAAGYKAMLAGVPESDIYALGEDMAEALSSAMDTVAGA